LLLVVVQAVQGLALVVVRVVCLRDTLVLRLALLILLLLVLVEPPLQALPVFWETTVMLLFLTPQLPMRLQVVLWLRVVAVAVHILVLLELPVILAVVVEVALTLPTEV
jgi:hypothetical protein